MFKMGTYRFNCPQHHYAILLHLTMIITKLTKCFTSSWLWFTNPYRSKCITKGCRISKKDEYYIIENEVATELIE